MKTRSMPIRYAGHRQDEAPARFRSVLLILVGWLASWSAIAQQTPSFPAGFNAVLVTNGISNPTAMAFAPDGRIFVCQQTGQVRVIKNGALLPTPFVSVAVNSSGERGLVGITLDPNFATNRYVYVYYTLASGANNRISRFTADGDVAAAGSETLVLNLDPLSTATNHNGGAMHFGLDGKLYVAVGENANRTNAPNLDSYMGKLLRINADGSVPAGNPYVGSGLSAQRQRVWSSGLRNPFTFTVQPGTGRIFINDVGEGSWEEINDASTGGRNFGWPSSEGYNIRTGETAPVFAYPHTSGFPDGAGCSITGGTFFNPAATNYPSQYAGKYFYQDYCGKWINYFDPNSTTTPLARQPFALNMPGDALALETGPDGNLYYLARSSASLFKVVYTSASSAPVITTQPTSVAAVPGSAATFSVAATGSAPLAYQWQKNGVNIAGATSSSYTIASVVAADAGQFRVVVSNGVGTVTSTAATLTIAAPNTAPTAQILTPATGATYVAGSTISFSGSATDAEDGTLPASAFVWQVDLHHDTHVHDGTPFSQGARTGTFVIPNSGELSDNVFYRLILTVTDAGGRTTTTFRDILPQKSTFTLATNPAGLSLTLDGTARTTPVSIVGVEGVLRTLAAPSTQTVGGVTYAFESWSNGGAQSQTIITPTNDETYTATYRVVPASAQAVTSLTLINADTDQPLAGYDPLPDGATLNLATLPTRNLNIRANTNPATVGSVRFTYDGDTNYKVETLAPYAIAGDNGFINGGPNYNAWTPAVGSHTLTVTPYTQGGAGGNAGTPLTIAFTVTNTVTPPTGGTLRGADIVSNPVAALNYSYYEGIWDNVPDFTALTPAASGTVATFSPDPRVRDDEFALRYTGYVQVPTDGVYTFYTSSDDGSQLYIGSTLVVDNNGLHGLQERSGQIGLKAGLHAITVGFFERGGDQVLNVSYAGPTLAKTLIPATALFHAGSGQPASNLRAPDNVANPVAGLSYSYYEGQWTAVPAFTSLTAAASGNVATFSVAPRLRDDEFAFHYMGYVSVPVDGMYTFYTSSDDGSQLYIGSTLVVDNDGMHGLQERSGQIGLQAGLHAISVGFFERGGDQILDVSYAGPGLSQTAIPAAALLHAAPASARMALATSPSARTKTTNDGSAVQLYPNPAREQLTVSLQANADEEVRVEVLDALARRVTGTVQRATAGRNEVHLSLSKLPSGVYMVLVVHGTERTVKRLIVAQ
ncbi:PQQ-dependent sugar dehydrogenase [Hymenobacter cellulosilyticus]|uniref:PQQ-dependent sugar dehydrogenase n=1 Tax=Hymenobacter cellulosilyticus TaxID=2932248 RepID=A0A8T9QB31_9BACT|nr:PQQ-dependent sugar dehydrogenase [Hymenobacter cellulosilyticus]UOQ74385.1 PQQ-dependent sugar dehydrogenase [Hymenobacter cellulosilyticus]